MHYEVRIISTGKTPRKSDEDFTTFSRRVECFSDTESIQQFLEETYTAQCRSKRRRIYHDTRFGTEHTGYVYRFRNSDLTHYPVDEWIQEDWVIIVKITEEVVIL